MCLIPVQFSKISAPLLPKSAVLIYQVSISMSMFFITFFRKILRKFVAANSSLILSLHFDASSFSNKVDNTYQYTLY